MPNEPDWNWESYNFECELEVRIHLDNYVPPKGATITTSGVPVAVEEDGSIYISKYLNRLLAYHTLHITLHPPELPQ